MFLASDLYKKKNLGGVFQTLACVAAVAPQYGFKGPVFKSAQSSNTNKNPVKKWGAVETAPKVLHSNELGDPLEMQMTKLSLELAELYVGYNTLKGEKGSLKSEITEYKSQIRELK